MTKKSVPPTLILGETTEEILKLDNFQEIRGYLNKKAFRVSDTELSYRQINFLDSSGSYHFSPFSA